MFHGFWPAQLGTHVGGRLEKPLNCVRIDALVETGVFESRADDNSSIGARNKINVGRAKNVAEDRHRGFVFPGEQSVCGN